MIPGQKLPPNRPPASSRVVIPGKPGLEPGATRNPEETLDSCPRIAVRGKFREGMTATATNP